MLESDLYAPIRDWLKEQGYSPKAEVKGVDIMAVKGETMLVVELKNTLNLEVILQAVNRQRLSEIVYIGVPKKGKILFTKRWKMLIHLLKRLELGLLLVSHKGEVSFVEEALKPILFNRIKSRSQVKNKRESALLEYNRRHGDQNTGGVNKVKIITAYRESALLIAYLLSVHGPMSPKKLRELGTDSAKTTTVLYINVYGWFEPIKKGVYTLTEKGSQALSDYKTFIDIIKQAGGLT